MYTIIGADQKEYGPITAEVLKQWITDGRVNGQTSVLPEGRSEWTTVGQLPEFAGALPSALPPPLEANPPGARSAEDLVIGPAIGLIVTGALNILFGALRAVVSLTGFGLGMLGDAAAGNDALQKMVMGLAGTAGIVVGGLCVAGGVITLLAGLKLRQLRSYGLCLTGTILAMIPCFSICCWIGVPIGIWALVMMMKPEVKAQFR